MFKVEKNVARQGFGKGDQTRKYPFPEMEVGDSFHFQQRDSRVGTAAYAWGKANGGKKFSVRKQADGTYRCWRVE
jgi:hypothetical protein